MILEGGRPNRTLQLVVWLALAAFSLAVLWADAPLYHPIPARDSGGFLYIGQQLLHGQRLYADLFDDKPPMIFLVNALGLWLSAGTPWGVWLLEVISLCATLGLAFCLLSRFTGWWPALLGLAAFLGNFLRLLLGGNFTEEYALPFQFLILVCILPPDLDQRLTWRAFLAGVAWAVVFFFKQSIFGFGLAAGGFLFIRGILQWKRGRFREPLFYAAGFLSVAGLVAGYFLLKGTLWEFWDATFLSNFAYIAPQGISRAASLYQTLVGLMTHGWFLAASLALWLVLVQGSVLWVDGLVRDWRGWPGWLANSRRRALGVAGGALLALVSLAGDWLAPGRQAFHLGLLQVLGIFFGVQALLFGLLQYRSRAEEWIKHLLSRLLDGRRALLLCLAGVAYLLDILSISLSGKGFTHYYLIIFPSALILVALFASLGLSLPASTRGKALAWAALLAVFTPLAFLPLANVPRQYRLGQDVQRADVVAYVEANTRPDAQVLMWGGEPVINYLTGRTRPNRFVFMTQLFLPGYAHDGLAEEMLRDLQSDPPQLIIYTHNCAIPFLDYQTQACLSLPEGWDAVYAYIQEHYVPLQNIGPEHWDVYQLKG